MLKRLILENFRAFESLDIPLTNINVFFGPNNSGKSAIISAITLLSQTLDSTDKGAPLLLKGKYEDLGSYWDVVYKNKTERSIRIGFEFDSKEDIPIPSNGSIDLVFHYRPQRREIVAEEITIRNPIDQFLLKTRVTKTSNTQLVEQVHNKYPLIKLGLHSSGTVELNHFIPGINVRAGMYTRRDQRSRSYTDLMIDLHFLDLIIRSNLTNLEFIGPFRKKPDRTQIFSGETPSSVGVSGEKTIDILASDESRRLKKKKNIIESVSAWLKISGIASKIELVPFSDRHFEIYIKHIHTNELVNLADAGYGCSQILPILVSGYHMKPNSIFIIEQPEIHLHPTAEAEVGTFLFNMYQKPSQLLIETHSEHLLLRLQSHVASGQLDPKHINVFYLYTDEKTDHKHIKLLPLGRDGYFTEKWPRGFFPERYEEAKRLAKYNV